MRTAPTVVLWFLAATIPATGQIHSHDSGHSGGAAANVRALIVLSSTNTPSMRSALQNLKRVEVKADHVFPPNALIARLPRGWVPSGSNHSAIVSIDLDEVSLSDKARFGPSAALAAEIWNHNHIYRVDAAIMPRKSFPANLAGDALVAPDADAARKARVTKSGPLAAPGLYETSEFLIGSVAVGIITPESNGAVDTSTENWDASRQNSVVAEIQAGLQWLKDNAYAPADVSFVYDIHHSVATSYEPISRPHTDEGLWIGEVMGAMGYTQTGYFTRVRSYVNAIRATYGTDWAFAIFVADSLNDADGMMTDSYFGYAYLQGPFQVQTYDNDGWGINRMDMVTAHETCHTFGAYDEYAASGCTDTGTWGYLNITNSNCENGSPTEECIMRSAASQQTSWPIHQMCTPTRQTLGWRDADSDGKELYDPVDTTPTNTLQAFTPDPTRNRTPAFSGTSRDIPCLSPTRTDVTINVITAVQWRVDSGAWQTASPTDGVFNADSEDFTFTPASALDFGTHIFEVRALNSVGNISSVAQDELTILDLCEIVVASAFGGAAPPVGSNLFLRGTDILCEITNSPIAVGGTTQYLCKGWTGGGDVPATGSTTNTGSITLTNDSWIAWVWTTNYWLALAPSNCMLDCAPGWRETGSNFTVTATPDAGYFFLRWTGHTNGCLVDSNRIAVAMTQARSVTALCARVYYVNDSSTADDAWCTAPGDDASDGLTAASPKLTVQAILDAYNLESGDIVRIDTGTYNLTADITVTNQDAGSSLAPVTFEASPYGVTIDRKNTASGNYAWNMNGGAYVTVRTAEGTNRPGVPQRWMKITGAYYGLYLNSGNYTTLQKLDVWSNNAYGVRVNTQYASLQNLLVRNTFSSSGYPIYLNGSYASVSNCTVVQTNGLYGVYVAASSCRLLNNILYAGGSGRYAIYASPLPAYSDYNDFHTTNGAYVGYCGSDCYALADWKRATLRDTNSLCMDPRFVDMAGGDYHLQSTAGSYHAGAWSADAADSPCVDTGSPYSPWSNEPVPSGSRINLGAYGNTDQTSKTPANRLLWICSPVGGEVYTTQSVPVTVLWTIAGAAWGASDTLRMDYSADGGNNWTAIGGAGSVEATNGWYSWDISAMAPGALYRIRLTCNDDAAVTARSPANFRIGSNLVFYVNDAATTEDAWCNAPGDDANTGTTSNAPKSTVQAILNTYNLEPGDIVRIDTGSYDLTNNITVVADDSGSAALPVAFEASPYGVTIDRKNTASGNYAWYVYGAAYVTIRTAEDTNRPGVQQRWMKITGAYYGLNLNSGNYTTLHKLDVWSNNANGVRVSTSYASLQNLLVRNTFSSIGYPIYVGNSYASVSNCTVVQTNGLYGIYVASSNCRLLNNIVYVDGSGRSAVYASPLPSLSDYNDLYATNGACVGFSGFDRRTLAEWRTGTGKDTNSISLDPLFVNVAGGDYHLRSTAGSYHGGAWTADAADSPCVDTGNPASDCSKEPAPNGSRINMGAYGNTDQASKTPAGRLLFLHAPAGGEVYPTQSVPVRVYWTRTGTAWQGTDTLNLEYSSDSGDSWGAIAGGGSVAVTNGYFLWDVSGLAAGALYRVRLTCNQDGAVTVQSAANFRIGTNLVFYVNDAATTDDAWCTAPGSDANTGTTSNAPKLTVQAILNTYDLEPGDVVRIDSGTYTLTADITVTNQDSGSSAAPVTFEASPYGTTINRNDTGVGNAWYVNGAAYLTIRTAEGTNRVGVMQRWMRITGGNYGLYLNAGDYTSLARLDVWSNNTYGVRIGTQYASLQNLIARNTFSASSYAIYVAGNNAAVSNCTVVQTNGTRGIHIGASNCRLLNNLVFVDGTNRYALYAASLPSLSDYNDLYATNGACVGFSASARTNLTDWKAATGKDTNSISADPLFAGLQGGDLHLSSIEGRYSPGGTWIGDTKHSPCIDRGSPASPYSTEPSPNGTNVNIGAYGNTEQASMSLTNAVRTILIASPLGGAVPPVGIHSYYDGRTVACSVTNSPIPGGASTQKVCIGWTMTGNIPASGTTSNCLVVLTNNASLTWVWGTNVQFSRSAGPNGSIIGAPDGYYTLGGNVTVTSVPALYYRFGAWSGDVPAGQTNANPLVLTLDRARTIAASFAANLATNNTPHWWLAQYGLATNDTGALYEDGDGLPAWQEYVAGTDPTNAASVLKFVDAGFAAVTNKFVLRWDSVAGRLYGVECTTNLAVVAFGVITSGIPATPTMNVWTDSVSAGSAQRYYRVSVSNAP